MENNYDINNLTTDQMKHLASEHLEEIRKTIDHFNRKCGGILSREECDDLELETYMRACDRACTYHPSKGTLVAWLKRIAHNAACDRAKDKSRLVRLSFDSYYDVDADEMMQRGLDRLSRAERDHLTVTGWSACEEVLAFEDRRKFRLQKECAQAAFSALRDRDRQLLYMRWELKLSGEEMAREMKMEHVALRVALSRAVDRFEEELEARHYLDIDERSFRYFGDDCYPEQEDDEDETFFGSRSETNG